MIRPEQEEQEMICIRAQHILWKNCFTDIESIFNSMATNTYTRDRIRYITWITRRLRPPLSYMTIQKSRFISLPALQSVLYLFFLKKLSSKTWFWLQGPPDRPALKHSLPSWAAFLSHDWSFTRMTVQNKSHIFIEQFSTENVFSNFLYNFWFLSENFKLFFDLFISRTKLLTVLSSKKIYIRLNWT